MSIKSANMDWLSLIIIALGGFFLFLTHRIPAPNSNEQAALWSGYLLLAIGFLTLLFREEIEIKFDNSRSLIRYRKKQLGREKKRQIAYDEIEHFTYRKVGRPTHLVQFYFLVIELKDGEVLRTGQYFFSKMKVNEWAEKLNRTIEKGN